MGDGLFLVEIVETRPSRKCWDCGTVSHTRKCPKCETIKGNEKVSTAIEVQRKGGRMQFDPPLTPEQYNVQHFDEKIAIAVDAVIIKHEEQIAEAQGQAEQDQLAGEAETQAQEEAEAEAEQRDQEQPPPEEPPDEPRQKRVEI